MFSLLLSTWNDLVFGIWVWGLGVWGLGLTISKIKRITRTIEVRILVISGTMTLLSPAAGQPSVQSGPVSLTRVYNPRPPHRPQLASTTPI